MSYWRGVFVCMCVRNCDKASLFSKEIRSDMEISPMFVRFIWSTQAVASHGTVADVADVRHETCDSTALMNPCLHTDMGSVRAIWWHWQSWLIAWICETEEWYFWIFSEPQTQWESIQCKCLSVCPCWYWMEAWTWMYTRWSSWQWTMSLGG